MVKIGLKWPKMVKMVKMVNMKSRGPKGLQLEVRARRAPRLPVPYNSNPKFTGPHLEYIKFKLSLLNCEILSSKLIPGKVRQRIFTDGESFYIEPL